MLNFLETFVRKARRWFSRSEWLIRLLRLTKTGGRTCGPGLVLVQIDGLSRHQLERAMAAGRMPFLAGLLRRHRYGLHSLYSGLPSSTPAMTAEVLYGVECAVPAFSFYDRADGVVHRMYESHSARKMDERMKGQSRPLLAGGSIYAGVYTGGAEEAHFCASTMALDTFFKARYPLRMALIVLFSIYSWLRAGVLIVIEFFLALFDGVRGFIAGQDLWKEIKFIPSRVGVSILMREMATVGAKIDMARGLPVISLDLLGYDEQAHRRGPSSRFAHWSLKGIDAAIGRVWRAAQRSLQRDYDVWIFSDHGSEKMISYVKEKKLTLQEAVSQVFGGTADVPAAQRDARGIQSRRMHFRLRGGRNGGPEAEPPRPTRAEPVVAAMGPVAHVYTGSTPDDAERDELARLLVDRAGIPMVSAAGDDAQACVWTKDGRFLMPRDAATVLDPNHPFLEDLARDFVTLTRHSNAGDFVLWGWNREGLSCTFSVETGAHGGPGLEETHAFVMLPDDVPIDTGGRHYPRPLDLRDAALRHLGRAGRFIAPAPAVAQTGLLRVMTYNVHSCMGIDGKLSPQRIARVIARYRPDVVALQEVDIGRRRTRHEDQAELIAGCLNMNYHFHPTIQIAEEAYGDCILSSLPMRILRTGTLPTLPHRDAVEPRGALWVAVELDGRSVQLVNTHLGLNSKERWLQMQAILGSDWLGGRTDPHPVILCGDFNASPLSRVYRLCARRFRDVQTEPAGRSPRPTWFGYFPFARIDHIFVDPRLQVIRVEVGDDYLSLAASDHRPLTVELKVPP